MSADLKYKKMKKALNKIALDRDMPASSMRVLLCFMAKFEFNEWVDVTLAELIELLEEADNRGNMSKALQRLVDTGYMEKEKIGRNCRYRVAGV